MGGGERDRDIEREGGDKGIRVEGVIKREIERFKS